MKEIKYIILCLVPVPVPVQLPQRWLYLPYFTTYVIFRAGKDVGGQLWCQSDLADPAVLCPLHGRLQRSDWPVRGRAAGRRGGSIQAYK